MQGKSVGNLLIFIASHPFSAGLFFLKHPVWNVDVASSWTRHSWITVLSCHCEGIHGVFMQTNVNTFPLDIEWWLLLWQTKYFHVPTALCHSFLSYGRNQHLAKHMLPSSLQFLCPVLRDVALSSCQY